MRHIKEGNCILLIGIIISLIIPIALQAFIPITSLATKKIELNQYGLKDLVNGTKSWPGIDNDKIFNNKEKNTLDELVSNKYRQHFFPIYIKGNDALTGLCGRLNGVINGDGSVDDPYTIANWEIRGQKFWKLFGRHYGIYIENVDKHVIIRNNYVHNWWHTIGNDYVSGGIYIVGCNNIIIENNVIENNRIGIESEGYHTVIRYNNISKNCYGIACALNSNAVVSNNAIFSNQEDGIICNHATARVTTNQIFSNGDCGIESFAGDKSFIEFNTIYDNGEDGIAFGNKGDSANSHPIISNNEIYSNRRDGISCWGKTESVIKNNSIYSNHADGIGCHNSNPTITDNRIFSNDDGIYCFDGKPYVSHNLISSNRRGIYDLSDGTMTIVNNTIFANDIGCYTSEHPQIHYNNIEGNGYAVNIHVWQWPLVNAIYNWWGSPDGPSGYGPGSGDPISDHLDFDPWLSSPNPHAGPR